MPASEFTDRWLPWTRGAFGVMVITGLLLFYATPVRYYQNVFFRVKVVLLVAAGINIWLFHSRVHRRVTEWDMAVRPPRAARVAAVVSLAAWAGVVVTGRMVAYNWFDCDIQPQSAFVNWTAGCVVPAGARDRAMTLLPFFEWCEATGLGRPCASRCGSSRRSRPCTCWGCACSAARCSWSTCECSAWASTRTPIALLARQATPWLVAGAATMIATGLPLFLSESVKCYYSQAFWVKITTLPLALLFTFVVRQRVALHDRGDGHGSARLVGAASIALWFTVAAAGRWIGFS